MRHTAPPPSLSKLAVNRFAHPFFVSAPPAARAPVHGLRQMLDWSRKQLGPVPQPSRGGSMALAEIIGAPGVQQIQDLGEIRFHSVGDTGVNHATEAEMVAEEMATDYHPDFGGRNPAFLLHLGDVIYGPDKQAHYGERFYRPYFHYPGKIIAVPGNHDGEIKVPADSPSLSAFLANFCASKAVVPPQAAGSGIYRETMTQPGVYWLLDAPFVRIIGLYSNRLENPGFLDGLDDKGREDKSQLDWLQQTLTDVAKAQKKDKKALVIVTHHPPFSQSGHSGSSDMLASIDGACKSAGIAPDVHLSGHAHNYQRYTRRLNFNGRPMEIPYIVAGTGGISPQAVAPAFGQAVGDCTYDSAVSSYGYLLLSVSPQRLKVDFWELHPLNNKAFDTVSVDLATNRLV